MYEEIHPCPFRIGLYLIARIFTAEEVGAPHRRERLFILGVVENAGILRWGRRYFADKRGSERKIQAKRPSSSLANSYINNSRTGFGNISEQEREGISEEDKRQWDRDEFRSFDSKMADTPKQRLQISRSTKQWEQSKENDERVDDRPKFVSNTMEHSHSGNEQYLPGKDTEATQQRHKRTIGQLLPVETGRTHRGCHRKGRTGGAGTISCRAKFIPCWTRNVSI